MNLYRFLILLFALTALGTQESYANESPRDQLIREEIAREDAGDLQGAIAVGKQILRINPRDVQTLNVIAGLYGKLGKFSDEIVWAKKAIAIDKNFHLAYVNYGNALFYLGRMDEARASFEKAKTLAPLDPLPVYSLGTLAEEQRKLNEAIGYFENSVALDPKFQPGLFSLAAMYANAKKFDAALATLDKLLMLNPNAQDAKNMRSQIENDKARLR